MSNSPLVDYTRLSPNYNVRTHKIDTITIHHMASNLSVEVCGAGFASRARRASSNYGVGTDGRIGMYVEEKNRSWCSNSKDNDDRAITIEVANDSRGPDWHVSDKALEATIELCVDICKRNGIERLNYTGDKTGNLTMHKWYGYTGCPGPYLGSKFPYIADEVNRRLGVSGNYIPEVEEEIVTPKEEITDDFKIGDEVKLVEGATYYNGGKAPSWLFNKKLYVRKTQGDMITVSIFKIGAITGTVNKNHLVKY